VDPPRRPHRQPRALPRARLHRILPPQPAPLRRRPPLARFDASPKGHRRAAIPGQGRPAMVVCTAMDKTRAPSSLQHACPCDLILEHLALSDLGDKEMEWWWSCRLNRWETMGWCVATADMRAREELLLACSDGGREKLELLHVASVKIRGKRLKAGSHIKKS